MAMWVRSDYDVTLKVKKADEGQIRALGSYSSDGVKGDMGSGLHRLAHLQRPHPSGRWLATVSSSPLRVDLHPLTLGKLDPSRPTGRVEVTGLRGHIQQFRWSADGRSLIFATMANAYVAEVDPSSSRRAVVARPVWPHGGSEERVQDMRILPDGFMVRTHEEIVMRQEDGWEDTVHHSQLHRFVVRSGQVVDHHLLNPREWDVTGATVLSGGRIALTVQPAEIEDAEEEHWDQSGQVWVLPADARSRRRKLDRFECGGEGWCGAQNWAPGFERAVFIDFEGNLTIQSTSPGQKPARVETELHDAHGLWVDPSGRRVLVANAWQVAVYDLAGHKLWDWSAEASGLLPDAAAEFPIASVHFHPDGRQVYAAMGNRVLLLDGTRASTVVTGRHSRSTAARLAARGPVDPEAADEFEGPRTFIDNVIPLAGGGVAYAVVSVRSRWAHDVGDMDPKIFMAPPRSDSLIAPFAEVAPARDKGKKGDKTKKRSKAKPSK